MNDISQLMKMAQAFAPPAGGAGGMDAVGPRITLAVIAAASQGCACAACGHLRAIVAAMESSVQPSGPAALRTMEVG